MPDYLLLHYIWSLSIFVANNLVLFKNRVFGLIMLILTLYFFIVIRCNACHSFIMLSIIIIILIDCT